jgi:predicted ATP-grasp superfamily ATP-dependent carboligase
LKNPVIVIGGTENGLGVIRNLGRKGIDVYSVVDEKDHTIFSKYCKRSFVSPGITWNRSKLKAFLMGFQRRLTCARAPSYFQLLTSLY